MPQIQILPGNPGFGTQLGQALGSGFSTGVQQGISSRLNQMLERKKDFGKIDSSVAKSYGRDWDLKSNKQKLEDIKRAREYFSQGDSLQDSVLQTRYHKELQAIQRPVNEKSQPTQSLPASLGQQPQFPTPEAQQEKPGFWKKNFGFRNPNEVAEDLQTIGQGTAQGATLGYVKAPKPKNKEQQEIHDISETAGGLLPVLIARRLGFKVLKPKTALGTIGTGAAVGTALSAAQQKINTGKIDPKQLGIDTAIWGGLEALFVAAPAVMKSFKPSIEKAAAQTGKKAEEILGKAVKDSEANLEKALAGDAKEINKINRAITKETPKVAEKVKETPKTVFNKEPAIKHHEAVGEKIKTSPYEAYYKVEAEKAAKEAGKKPETRAKEAEITQRVKPLEEAKAKELKSQRNQLADLEKDAKNATGEVKSRIESSIGFKQREIQKTLDELRDLRHELRHFEKRPTDAQIEARGRKSAEEFVAEAKNPTEAGQKGIKRQLDLDKDFLERSDKLIARGEIPGDVRPDTFLRMKEKYLEGYKAMIKELRESNKALQGARDAESLKKVSDNKNAINYLEGRNRRLMADIINQKDKIKALKAVEGPSGAFYRQQLKSVQKDVAQFQHDAIKVPKVKAPSQMKAEKVAPNEIKKAGEFIEKAGISKKDVQSVANDIKPELEKAASAGSPKEAISQMGKKIEEATDKVIRKAPRSRVNRYVGTVLRASAKQFLIYLVTGGAGVTLYQAFNNMRFKSDKESYIKAKDSDEKDKLVLQWKAKGYTHPKIRSIIEASEAQEQLPKE